VLVAAVAVARKALSRLIVPDQDVGPAAVALGHPAVGVVVDGMFVAA
jgi:hypothetical protein